MKAIDIINFINEDKFVKYTAQQIYDELGEEEFLNYIKKIMLKIINKIDFITSTKDIIVGRETNTVFVNFRDTIGTSFDFTIQVYYFFNSKMFTISSVLSLKGKSKHSSFSRLSGDITDISNALPATIDMKDFDTMGKMIKAYDAYSEKRNKPKTIWKPLKPKNKRLI
jgi:hypothetical protein